MKTIGLKLKICGMRDAANVFEVVALKPDYIGFIFYLKSPRFVGVLDSQIVRYAKSQGIEPVAVFVDSNLSSIIQMLDLYGMTHVQLHGKETPETCRILREKGFKVLKVFNIADYSDLEMVKIYEGCCDYFLFDTKTTVPGGSSCRFDWNILKDYSGKTPFFLSGGIGPNDVEQIRSFDHPMFLGIDVNSRFEIQPALKDVALLNFFINQLILKNIKSNAK
jgi:phosphoribosylanthranilate isomerase